MIFQVKICGYEFFGISCTNGAVATFDKKAWSLNISNITTTNTTCRINFTANTVYNQVMSNLDNDSALENIFRNQNYAKNIVENENLMNEIVENSKLRNLLYDNAEIFEPLIANSEIALNAMKNSSRYEVISRTGQNKSFYNGKCFVLGFSQAGGSCGEYTVGQFLSSFTSWNPSGYNSNNGLSFRVNKFASSLYINGIWGTSINWDNSMYAAIFKI